MTKIEISEAILRAMAEKGWAAEDVRVQPDGYGNWNIAVVSRDFHGVDQATRKAEVLKYLGASIEWLELLTPSEKEWAGDLFPESDLDDIPFWPDTLAKANQYDAANPVIFPSFIDDDLTLPIIATFYSLRGGVGRSTALAYSAHVLASRGKKVVCVDMDLEAPGVTSIFGKEKDVEVDKGIVTILTDLDNGKNVDITSHLIKVSTETDLYCLPAGVPNAEYARKLKGLAFEGWYREEKNPLHQLINALKYDLPFQPDVILLDARTGISELNAPLLFDIADLSIIVFFPHPQAFEGTASLVKGLLSSKSGRIVNGQRLTPEPRFIVSPIPSSKAPEVVQKYQHRALEWVATWLSSSNQVSSGTNLFNESEITHFVPYKETIATSDQLLLDSEVWRTYEPVSDWLMKFLPTIAEKDTSIALPDVKTEILSTLTFATGRAEVQDNILESFVESGVITKALDDDIPLILGRKGTGKTALFRRISEDPSKKSVIITSPSMKGRSNWILSVDGYKAISDILIETKTDWREFWTVYTAIATYYSLDNTSVEVCDSVKFPDKLDGQIDTLNLLKCVLSNTSASLAASDYLGKVDDNVKTNLYFLFDGLDTGFGSTIPDIERRKTALEGLFPFLLDTVDRWKNLKFKILLREDIWRNLKFQNKSHYYGRSVTLKWNEPAAFFKIALKHAFKNQHIKTLCETRLHGARDIDIKYWGDDTTWGAWSLLVGERMKGANTAFTKNWVWSRLADGNDDHSPRYLLQLMHSVANWEREEQKRSLYDRSIIRPRGLMEVLPEVSVDALSAVKDEEFPELSPLMERLVAIGRTPFSSEDVKDTPGYLLDLAREVGLLALYEGTEDKVERYKVPDLYRYALNMTRKGQA